MSVSEHFPTTPFPESNVESVTCALVAQTADLDGAGLVEAFRILLARAEELKEIWGHSARTSQAMLAGQEPITQEAVDAQLQDTLYETTCLKWFLAGACKRLAEDLEYDVYQKQSRVPRVKSVVYSDEGKVETFDIAIEE